MCKKAIIFVAVMLTSMISYARAMDEVFYFKSSFGVGISRQKASGTVNSVSNYIIKQDGQGLIGGVSVGGRFKGNMRAGLEILADNGLRAKSKSTFKNQPYRMKTSSYVTFANFYYDFKNANHTTPFITLGAGYGVNKYKVTVLPTNTTTLLGREFSKTSNGVALQAGLGLAYNIGKAELELEYRFIKKGGRDRTVTLSGATINSMWIKGGSSLANVFMAGLRVGF